MKKIIRFSIPFVAACLMLGMIFYMAGASNRATAAPSPSTLEGAILSLTLEPLRQPGSTSQDRS